MVTAAKRSSAVVGIEKRVRIVIDLVWKTRSAI